MTVSINSVLNMGLKGLISSQTGTEVTGNNISNLDTTGYSRQEVVFEDGMYIDANPGQLGTGGQAVQIKRDFSDFIEKQYLEKSSTAQRWSTLNDSLSSVDSLFNESGTSGISSALTAFFNSWLKLSQNSSDTTGSSTRETLLSDTETLINGISGAYSNLETLQSQTDASIKQDVNSVNTMLQSIASLNKQIGAIQSSTDSPNGLLDDRSALVRQLAEKLDINYIDNGGGNVTITTKSGQTLVDGDTAYSLSYLTPQSFKSLSSGSTYDGNVHFSGTDDYEYTIKMTQGGQVSNAGGAEFQVSLDGGATWLRNADGTVRTFSAHGSNAKITVDNLQIWFDPSASNLSAGDTFTIVPKNGLYWEGATGGIQNITPQITATGSDNTRRLTGGTLAGEFEFRDNYIGQYKAKLDSLSKGLIWEVNRLHSQGTGLTSLSQLSGTYGVQDDNFALGSDSSGLAYGSYLQSGSAMMYFYDASTGKCVSGGALSHFTSPMGSSASFNPAVNSLQSVCDAINNSYGTYVTASIINHKLQLTAKSGYTFAMGDDTTGLYAALGLNTYFTGSDAGSLGVRDEIAVNTGMISAGHVNGGYEFNAGDNTTAASIAKLQSKSINLTTFFGGTTSQSLSEYYNSLVANVGADASKAKFNYTYQNTLANDLASQQDSVSGVNLDEELTNLIKYQHSYQAAAKLISTADQMLQTLLGIKN